MSLKIVKTLALDFTREAPLEYIFVKAGDKDSRILDITPLNSGLPYEIPAGTKVVFAAKKPDRTEVLNEATLNASTGHIEVTLSEQTLAAEGIIVCEVGLYNSAGDFLSSQHFYLKAGSFALTDIESSNEYAALVVALHSVDAKVREAEEIMAEGNAKLVTLVSEAQTHAAAAENSKNHAAASEQEARTVLADAQSKINRNDARISNLEAAVYGDLAQMVNDDTVAYVKNVPANVVTAEDGMSRMRVNRIGGMTRKCTNLILPYSNLNSSYGITFEENSDGSITVNGTATNDVYKKVGDVKLYAGQTHFLSGSPTGSSWNTYCMYVSSSYPDLGKGVAFTPSSTQGSLNIFIKSGTTLSNVTFYPMLNEGSTALPYEPYFEGLRSASTTEVESVGVNLLPFPYFENANTVAGVTWTANSDGSITGVGVPTSNSWLTLGFLEAEWVKSATLYFGLFGTYAGMKLYVTIYDGNNAEIASVNVTSPINIDFSAYPGTTRVRVRLFRLANETEISGTIYPTVSFKQLNEYIPYQKCVLPIPEEVRNLDGYGWGVNESVYNYIDFEKKQFVKRVEKVVFDGSADEIWFKYNTTNTYLIEVIRRKKATQCAVCDKFTYKKNCWDSPDVSGAYCDHPTLPSVYFNTEFTTPSEFRAWLAENPTTLYYELAEPIITDISDTLPADNFIGVEGGGTLTFKNEYEYDVPSSVTYITKGGEIV